MPHAQVARFVMVGLANTLTGLLVIFACKGLLRMGDVASNLVGYGVGIGVSFLLNKRWTFAHADGFWRPLMRYLLVLVLAYGANLATALYAILTLQINSYLAQAAGALPYTVVGYLGSRHYVFAPSNAR